MTTLENRSHPILNNKEKRMKNIKKLKAPKKTPTTNISKLKKHNI
jgi:hypothetical protein